MCFSKYFIFFILIPWQFSLYNIKIKLVLFTVHNIGDRQSEEHYMRGMHMYVW